MLPALFLTFCGLSLVAVGGATALLPEMHRVLVQERGWIDEASFGQLYALAQAAPGPNILMASAMGWRIGGWPGMAVATVGIIGPSALLAYAVGGAADRLAGRAWVRAVKAGLVPLAIGLMLASGLIMAQAGSGGWRSLAITAGAAAFVWGTGRNPLWALAAGGVVGVVVW